MFDFGRMVRAPWFVFSLPLVFKICYKINDFLSGIVVNIDKIVFKNMTGKLGLVMWKYFRDKRKLFPI